MIDPSTWLLYVAASVAILIVPGPTVTVIIANSLRAGTAAGLMNIAGTQLGLAVMIGILAAGLSTIVAVMGQVFDIVRLLGAAYLVWLGIKLWWADGSLADAPANAREKSGHGYFWQGFAVLMANPKALVFFGAFIPQFVDPSGNTLAQIVLLGGTFMVLAFLLDGLFALAAGKTGSLLSRHNVRLLERVSGTCLIGGGVWLALARR